jgi:peptidoglycan/LPS O-acetylase OafA/YrhL
MAEKLIEIAAVGDRRGIPSLDGLRAISILMVVLGHGSWALSARLTSNTFFSMAIANGGNGVAVFFVISGFLITNLLLKEFDKTGTVSLRHFYFRRSMRIFPAFYVYLVALGVLWFMHRIPEDAKSFVASATYLWSLYPNARGYFLQHSWSLSIEEIFYLLWPFLLVLLYRRGRLIGTAIGIILLMPLVRLGAYFAFPSLRGYQYYLVYDWLDTMMVGCVLALINQRLWFVRWKQRYLRWWVAGLMTLTAFYLLGEVWLLLQKPWQGFFAIVAAPSVRALCIAGMLIYVVDHADGWAGRLLNLSWVRAIGMVSYSLYLWQQLFLSEYLHLLPLGLLYLALAATASYWLVEQPMLKLRARIERSWKGRLAPRNAVESIKA